MTANVYIHGDLNTAGSFREDDRYLLRTSRHLARIKSYLDKVPVDIEMHFVHRKMPAETYIEESHFFSDNVGLVSEERIKEIYLVDIAKTQAAMTVVFVDNEGTQRIPLTPWMVLHRLSHALIIRQNKAHSVYWHFVNIISNATTRYRSNGKNEANDQDMIGMFGTTHAARTDRCRDSAEWYHDSFAQFCLKGDIWFKAAQQETQIKGKKLFLKKSYTTDNVDFIFYGLAADLKTKFQDLLNQTCGAIVVL